MKLKNVEGLSADALENEVEKGGRFIYFAFTVSLIVVTFKRTSGVFLLRSNESAVKKSIPYSLLSLVFGWWGIPFGPKHTIQSIRTNMKGGKDVTDEVMSTIAGHKLFREVELAKNRQPKTA